MSLTGGTTFADYTIVRLLGSGGMGEVYLAEHPRLPRLDALKILPVDVSADTSFRERFAHEADLAAKLWHPHIVGVHDRGEYEGQLWIAMGFVDGTDAARLLTDRYPGGMPEDEVAQIVTAVASALDYGHKRGLLHTDVKPANIMLAHPDDVGDQRILLTDFGIARDIDEISGLTTTNMTVGTVAYAAPEQLMGEQIDGRADLRPGGRRLPSPDGIAAIPALQPGGRHQPPPQCAAALPRRQAGRTRQARPCAGRCTGQESCRPFPPMHGLRTGIHRNRCATRRGADGRTDHPSASSPQPIRSRDDPVRESASRRARRTRRSTAAVAYTCGCTGSGRFDRRDRPGLAAGVAFTVQNHGDHKRCSNIDCCSVPRSIDANCREQSGERGAARTAQSAPDSICGDIRPAHRTAGDGCNACIQLCRATRMGTR
jgi:serine/threonine protein kinase